MLFLISSNQKADAPETPSSGSGNTVVSESGSIQELVNKIEAEEKIKQEEKREEKDSQENSEKQEAEMASGSWDTSQKHSEGFWSFLTKERETTKIEDKEDTEHKENKWEEGSGVIIEEIEKSQTGSTLEEKNEKAGFWSFLTRSKREDISDEQKEDEELTASWLTIQNETQTQENKSSSQETVSSTTIPAQNNASGGNYVKSTQGNTSYYRDSASKNIQKTQSQNWPGVDLTTAIGKSYQVGVYSLKLNNATFSQTLGYLMQGDYLTQLTSENSYGCFQVRVDYAQHISAGTTGYVCKKYLSDSLPSIDMQTQEEWKDSKEVNDQPSQEITSTENTFPITHIGETLEVETSLIFDGVTLMQGDILDQMTEADTRGCFTARVFQTSTAASLGQVVKNICYIDILK